MATPALRVEGLNELIRALGKINKELRRELQRGLQEAAKPVAQTAQAKLSRYRGAAVSGIRPRVRGSTAIVEQRKGTVTGKRGDFGAIVMKKALIPALAERRGDVEQKLENVLDELGRSAGF